MEDDRINEVAAQISMRRRGRKREAIGEKSEPASLGYAVIETDDEGNHPSFCVHGPEPVETDYAYAHDQWRYLVGDNRPGRRYAICKLVPVEPVKPEGDPDDRLPFDWGRTDKKIADGRITDPLWVEIHEASKKTRERLGIAGTMADACNVPHPYTQADGHPYDKVEHRLEQSCAACGVGMSLMAHEQSFPRNVRHAFIEAEGLLKGRCKVCGGFPSAQLHQDIA